MNPDLLLSAYDYQLPEEQIAQTPVIPRDHARLLVVTDQTHHHQVFHELPDFLKSGDLLILNNTRVLPARLYGQKPGGSAVEVLLLEEQQRNQWLALVKPGRRLKPGSKILFSPLDSANSLSLSALVVASDQATRGRILQFEVSDGRSLLEVLDQFGQLPLPPYITETDSRPEQYQTIYADRPGAVAAPTAGLHFTSALLDRLQQKGIDRAFVTLHVGVGTFRPVEAEEITQHQMHGEWIEVPPETVERIQQTKARGGRIIAVGTTSVRSLEGAAQSGEIQPYYGKTTLFIYPGYQWRVVDGLITNFHLPKSSLLMLVSALIGRKTPADAVSRRDRAALSLLLIWGCHAYFARSEN